MKIFLPPLEIDDDEGFTAEKDLFGRKDFGDGLTRLVTNVDDPLVIALDGQWGSGKTTFLKMWAGELRKQGFPVVFFDAFANDYMTDAFMALAGQIVTLAEKTDKRRSARSDEFVTQAKRVGKVLLRSSLKIALKSATLGVLDSEALEGVAKEATKDIAKEASDLEDKYIGELLTQQAQEKDAIEGFKKSLEMLSGSLIEEIPAAENGSNTQKKRLVFIIDELDRCRPDFALSLLERIKHFFMTKNVYFVIGANLQQLCSSVRLCYGQDVDANYYLQKFFHINFEINVASDPKNTSIEYVNFLIRQHDIENRQEKDLIEKMVLLAAWSGNLSFRTLERVMSYICIAVAVGYNNIFGPVLIGVLIIKISNPALYEQLRQRRKFRKLNESEVFEALGLNNVTNNADSAIRYAQELWRYTLGGEATDSNFREVIKSVENISGGRREILPFVFDRFVNRFVLPGQ